MANTLQARWIKSFLLDTAKKRGAEYYSEPRQRSTRKVQITRIIAGPRIETPDDCVWALLSDKQFEITAKFTKDAVVKYNDKSLITGEDPEFERQRRLTALRFAVVSIRDFKLSFGHIQTGEGSKSDYETLWLEVDEFRVLGSKMDGLFGNPLNILLDPDIKIWVDGLSKGGGSGNVLKLTMKEENCKGIAKQDNSTTLSPTDPTTMLSTGELDDSNSRLSEGENEDSEQEIRNSDDVNLKTWTETKQWFSRLPQSWGPSQKEEELLDKIKVFGEEDEPIQSQGSGIVDTLDIPELANDLLELKQDGDNEQSEKGDSAGSEDNEDTADDGDSKEHENEIIRQTTPTEWEASDIEVDVEANTTKEQVVQVSNLMSIDMDEDEKNAKTASQLRQETDRDTSSEISDEVTSRSSDTKSSGEEVDASLLGPSSQYSLEGEYDSENNKDTMDVDVSMQSSLFHLPTPAQRTGRPSQQQQLPTSQTQLPESSNSNQYSFVDPYSNMPSTLGYGANDSMYSGPTQQLSQDVLLESERINLLNTEKRADNFDEDNQLLSIRILVPDSDISNPIQSQSQSQPQPQSQAQIQLTQGSSTSEKRLVTALKQSHLYEGPVLDIDSDEDEKPDEEFVPVSTEISNNPGHSGLERTVEHNKEAWRLPTFIKKRAANQSDVKGPPSKKLSLAPREIDDSEVNTRSTNLKTKLLVSEQPKEDTGPVVTSGELLPERRDTYARSFGKQPAEGDSDRQKFTVVKSPSAISDSLSKAATSDKADLEEISYSRGSSFRCISSSSSAILRKHPCRFSKELKEDLTNLPSGQGWLTWSDVRDLLLDISKKKLWEG